MTEGNLFLERPNIVEENNYDEVEQENSQVEDSITTPFSPSDINLSTPPMNMGDLIDRITYGWINFGTNYQREENLWTEKQQSRLIESVLLGLRLPAFYFEEINKKKWDVIDGLQRCCAIRNFCVDKSLHLHGLEFLVQFEDCSYDELPFDVLRDIRMLPITVNKLEPGVPDQVKYILFKRLNTGGIELTPQEIRNAVFQGRAIEVVSTLANNSFFLDFVGNRINNRRKQREDFISRFIAFYLQGYKDYTPDLENFINKSMEILKKGESGVPFETMQADFVKAIEYSRLILGDEAYRKQVLNDNRLKPLNKAYFEVIVSTFSKMTEDELKQLLGVKDLLLFNMHTSMLYPSYSNSYSGGTGLRDAVKRRHEIFRSIVTNSLLRKKASINHDNKLVFE